MKYDEKIKEKELEFVHSEGYKLGTYLYMGMGECNGEKVCLSVAYKIDYCEKKAKEFEEITNGLVKFTHINKVKTGEIDAEEKYYL